MVYICNANFSGNILVVGRTDCKKSTFAWKLGLSNFFRNIKNVGLGFNI